MLAMDAGCITLASGWPIGGEVLEIQQQIVAKMVTGKDGMDGPTAGLRITPTPVRRR
jgi:hypothetical protein